LGRTFVQDTAASPGAPLDGRRDCSSPFRWRQSVSPIERREECAAAATSAIGVIASAIKRNQLNREFCVSRDTARSTRPDWQDYDAYIDYAIFTGMRGMPNYRQPMRYFFHIVDGPKVFPDERGSSLSSPEIAVQQAKALARELTMAGALCRSNLVLVLDETGDIIFKCWAACSEPAH
jgi:hypothetical protein